MKKLIFFSLTLVAFVSCRKIEEPCPHNITCRIYELDSNLPVPYGKVNFYKQIFMIFNPYELVQSYTADANGYFTVSSDLKCDLGVAVASAPGQYGTTGWNEVNFNSNAESMTFYISCFSTVFLSLYDDPNINSAPPTSVGFTTTNPFFSPYDHTIVSIGETGDSLNVKSYHPSQLTTTAHYADGSIVYDTIDVPVLSSGEQFLLNYPY